MTRMGLLLAIAAIFLAHQSGAGNPQPADLSAHRLHASTVLKRSEAGAVRFVNPGRDQPNLIEAARTGRSGRVVFSLSLLQTLDRLSARSTPAKPLGIMSLYRPGSKAHGSGVAVDISEYAGFGIDSRKKGHGLPAILSIIDALGPGEYSLGLPKPPNSDPIPLMPPPGGVGFWPYFPPPQPRVLFNDGRLVVAPLVDGGRIAKGRRGKLQPKVMRWANGRSAPLEDLGSRELREALAATGSRGIRIRYLFPDALDHLHLEAR